MFERPSLQEIVERVQRDAESRLDHKPMRFSLVTVLCRVIAGVAHSLYGYISFVMRQCFSSTAEAQFLERRASEIGVYRRPATHAEGEARFEGSGVVREGTALQSQDGNGYVTTSDSVNGVAKIRAVLPGRNGNLPEGSTLALVSPVVGVLSSAKTGEVKGGVDAEDDESLRERLLFRQRNPPRAGTASDFVHWARSVPGVTRAWCYPKELGESHVTVRFMTDGLTEDGIPSETLQKRVQEYIESQMSITTILDVVAPIPETLRVEVEILPDSEELRERVEAAIQEVVLNESEPSRALSFSSLDRAIANIRDLKSYRLVSPTQDVVPDETGKIFVKSKVTFR